MELDPKLHPRFLGGEEADDEAEREAEAAEIQAKLAPIREMEDLFTRPGWRHLIAEADARFKEDVAGLVTGDIHDPQEDAVRRGRAQVYRWLLGFAEEKRSERDTLGEQFRTLEASQNEGSEE